MSGNYTSPTVGDTIHVIMSRYGDRTGYLALHVEKVASTTFTDHAGIQYITAHLPELVMYGEAGGRSGKIGKPRAVAYANADHPDVAEAITEDRNLQDYLDVRMTLNPLTDDRYLTGRERLPDAAVDAAIRALSNYRNATGRNP